jgi:FkbM family methyltransferase
LELKLSYIDIGAWRPIAGSNTFFLYNRGFYGTAVEPNPHLAFRWKKLRPHDQFINCGVGMKGKQDFFLFEENSPANSFDSKFIEEISAKESVQIGSKVKIECKTLEDIIKIHLSVHSGDYVLDIDVEGLDYEVLTSFDFKSYHRPILISVEDTESPLINSRINGYLTSKQYFLLGRTVLTSIYGDTKRIELKNLPSITCV